MTTTTMNPVENLLRRTRAHIEDPARWTQKTSARNAEDRPFPPWAEEATRWCLVGALDVCSFGGDDDQFNRAYDLLRALVPDGRIGHFNDTHTHAEVLALLDTAISKAQRQDI